MFQPYKTRRYRKKVFYSRTGFVSPREYTSKARVGSLVLKHELIRKYYFSLLFAERSYYTF